MLAFFATIGLGADARMLARGGVALLLFTACVVGMLVMQNVIGVGAALAMGIDPLIGLIAGSVTMSGGHGTGAAWGQKFRPELRSRRGARHRARCGDLRPGDGRPHRRARSRIG